MLDSSGEWSRGLRSLPCIICTFSQVLVMAYSTGSYGCHLLYSHGEPGSVPST